MDQFIQYTPTEVVFGKETENQAGAEVKKWGGTKVLVVYGGGSAKRSGLLDRVEASLAKEGLAFEELGGVKPNPRLALAEEGVKKAVEMQADFILAIPNPSDEDLRALSMDATQQDTVKLSRIRKLGAQEVYEIYQMAR